MAIDTTQKRAAALGVCVPTVALVVPSGGITSAVLRAQTANAYLPDSGGSPPVVTARRNRSFASRFRRVRRRR